MPRILVGSGTKTMLDVPRRDQSLAYITSTDYTKAPRIALPKRKVRLCNYFMMPIRKYATLHMAPRRTSLRYGIIVSRYGSRFSVVALASYVSRLHGRCYLLLPRASFALPIQPEYDLESLLGPASILAISTMEFTLNKQ